MSSIFAEKVWRNVSVEVFLLMTTCNYLHFVRECDFFCLQEVRLSTALARIGICFYNKICL